MTLRGLVASIDGTTVHQVSRRAPASDAEAMGIDAGRELRALAGPNLFK
jgi:hydroxymethylbilane synthase